jgi:hypothetical protein
LAVCWTLHLVLLPLGLIQEFSDLLSILRIIEVEVGFFKEKLDSPLI